MAFNWTPEAEEFLRNYYPTHKTSELAEALGVTSAAIRSRACALKIKKDFSTVPEGHFLCARCKQVFPKVSDKRSNGYCNACRRELYWEKKEQKVIEDGKIAQGYFEIELHKKRTASETYICSRCKEEKPGDEFKYDGRRKKRETICKECRSKRDENTRLKSIREGRGW